MKEAHFVSILTHPRLDVCAQTAHNQDKSLVITFLLKGQNATSFSKDLLADFLTWQINSPEQLHQKILDLLSFLRQKQLEIEFALSLIGEKNIIFACYDGAIILKRNNQSKKILDGQQEIKIIVGNFKDNDQIILINQSSMKVEEYILSLLESNVSLEKLVGEISLIKQEQADLNESLAFLTYKERVLPSQEKKVKIDLKKILNKLQIFVKKTIFIVKKIYLRLKNQNRKKLMIWLAIFLTLAFLSFTTVALAQNQKAKTTQNIKDKIVEIEKNQVDIEQLTLEQPLQAREIAGQRLQLLQALKEEKNNSESLKLIDSEIEKVEKLIEKIAGENSLDKLSIAYNLNDFIGKKIVTKNSEIFILENSGQEILRIKSDGNQEKISLEDRATIRDFTVTENKLFILGSGLKMLDLQNNQGFVSIKEEGESDKNGELLSSFGPYLYLLNREKRNIYRYYYNQDQLSEPIGWLVDKSKLNFDNINQLLVDGDLWLGMKNGNVNKFSKGYPVDWQMQGVKQLPENPILIGSNEESNLLVVLEKQNKRILVLTKDGQLISEIKSNELSGVSDIALNQNGELIYVLSGSVIYDVKIDP